jgi:hypothetical protein
MTKDERNTRMSMKTATRVEVLLAFGFGAILLIAMLIVVLKGEQLDDQEFFVVRLVLALSAAAVAAIIPGFLQLTYKNTIRTGGAISIFVLVYYVNPPSPPEVEIGQNEHSVAHKGWLGDLENFLVEHVSLDLFQLKLAPGVKDELRNFYVEHPIKGSTWAELFKKLCMRYDCLKCTPRSDRIVNSVTIDLNVSPLRVLFESREMDRPPLTCP